MAVNVLIGVQWGDEGKGKIIDVLTENADMVVRFQGGANAGHTVEVGDKKFVLHLIPSGMLREGKVCVIGNGVVVDPLELKSEIEGLEARGVEVRSRLQLSDRAHLVLPYHKSLDGMREDTCAVKIGTTRRGIGPAYADKANRIGIRCGAMTDKSLYESRFRTQLDVANKQLAAGGGEPLDADAEWVKLSEAADFLAPMITDTALSVNGSAKAGKSVLFEGAQGYWLDVDHGTYPFVTSSNTSVGGACTGGGIAPNRIDDVWGVVKAYTTRVGEGPFPTELLDAAGEALRQAGNEFGATTGRPRRCGWFDAVACSYAAMVCGVTKIAFTKVDVLDDLAELKICTAYRINGEVVESVPSDCDLLAKVEPIYETMPGWQENTCDCRRWEDLPANAQAYLKRLAELTGADIGIVSTGPNRAETFFA